MVNISYSTRYCKPIKFRVLSKVDMGSYSQSKNGYMDPCVFLMYCTPFQIQYYGEWPGKSVPEKNGEDSWYGTQAIIIYNQHFSRNSHTLFSSILLHFNNKEWETDKARTCILQVTSFMNHSPCREDRPLHHDWIISHHCKLPTSTRSTVGSEAVWFKLQVHWIAMYLSICNGAMYWPSSTIVFHEIVKKAVQYQIIPRIQKVRLYQTTASNNFGLLSSACYVILYRSSWFPHMQEYEDTLWLFWRDTGNLFANLVITEVRIEAEFTISLLASDWKKVVTSWLNLVVVQHPCYIVTMVTKLCKWQSWIQNNIVTVRNEMCG